MPVFNGSIGYFLVALGLAVLVVPLMRPISFFLGAVDKGEGRRIHSGVIPRLGGIGLYLAFLIPMVFSLMSGAWDDTHQRYWGILAGSLIIILIGFYDDLKGAKVSHKLIAEVIAALVIYFCGISIEHMTIPFVGTVTLGWLSLLVTVLWVVVITNAINLIDGMDGLAAGTGIFIALTFLFTADPSMPHLMLTCIILIGALTGFLIYNFPPASIFMGDSGSLFVGFLLAALSIRYSFKATALATMMVPMVVFTIPLADMTYAVVRRYYRGVALGSPDKEHIHHKLLEMGFSKTKVLIVISTVNVLVMMTALFALKHEDRNVIWLIVVLFLLVIASVHLLGYQKFVPFTKGLVKHLEMNRKRRYNNFLIRRFRHHVLHSRSGEEVKACLQEIVAQFGFNSVRLYVYASSADTPLWEYGVITRDDSISSLLLSIPLISEGSQWGRVKVARAMDDEPLLCLFEFFSAISEASSRLVELENLPSKAEIS